MNPLLPLFPLDLVLLPGVPLPLHIFEPRYKEMIKECMDQKQAFGIVRAKEEGFANIGCTAEVMNVLKTYPDGRMNILAVSFFGGIGLCSWELYYEKKHELLWAVGLGICISGFGFVVRRYKGTKMCPRCRNDFTRCPPLFCHICGKKLAFTNYARADLRGAWEIEHSVPRAKGGTDHLNNLYPACISCNRDKATVGSRSARAWHSRHRAPLSREKRREVRSNNRAIGTLVGALLGTSAGGIGILLGGAVGYLIGGSLKPSNG